MFGLSLKLVQVARSTRHSVPLGPRRADVSPGKLIYSFCSSSDASRDPMYRKPASRLFSCYRLDLHTLAYQISTFSAYKYLISKIINNNIPYVYVSFLI